jgi:hypothetical protein
MVCELDSLFGKSPATIKLTSQRTNYRQKKSDDQSVTHS